MGGKNCGLSQGASQFLLHFAFNHKYLAQNGEKICDLLPGVLQFWLLFGFNPKSLVPGELGRKGRTGIRSH